jgi:hypothetical protein
VDFNGDGNIDLLTSGFAGFGYIFYGNNHGSLNAVEPIVDRKGDKLRFGLYWDSSVKRWIYTGKEAANSTSLSDKEKAHMLEMEDNCVIIKAIDWDNDGDMDLILSGRRIGAKICVNEGTLTKPVFESKFISVITTKGHMANAIIDWDGDGLFDILSSSKEGGVYFYKNYGKMGTPLFKNAVCIIESSLLISGEHGGECGLTYVSASDYNNDGKLDLLIGSKNTLIIPAPKLSKQQIEERDELFRKKEKVSAELNIFYEYFKKEYGDSKTKLLKARKKDKEYQKLRERYTNILGKLSKFIARKKTHGYVWVSLRK